MCGGIWWDLCRQQVELRICQSGPLSFSFLPGLGMESQRITGPLEPDAEPSNWVGAAVRIPTLCLLRNKEEAPCKFPLSSLV